MSDSKQPTERREHVAEQVCQQAACAHLRVSWRTESVPGGRMRGWWECDSNCGMRFAPSGVAAPAAPPAPKSMSEYRRMKAQGADVEPPKPLDCGCLGVCRGHAPQGSLPAGGGAQAWLEREGLAPVQLAAQHFCVKSLAELLDAYAASRTAELEREIAALLDVSGKVDGLERQLAEALEWKPRCEDAWNRATSDQLKRESAERRLEEVRAERVEYRNTIARAAGTREGQVNVDRIEELRSAERRVEELRPYVVHKGLCRSGSRVCVCKHHNTQHFMEQPNKPCAHCKCKHFTEGGCTCGLAALLAGEGE